MNLRPLFPTVLIKWNTCPLSNLVETVKEYQVVTERPEGKHRDICRRILIK